MVRPRYPTGDHDDALCTSASASCLTFETFLRVSHVGYGYWRLVARWRTADDIGRRWHCQPDSYQGPFSVMNLEQCTVARPYINKQPQYLFSDAMVGPNNSFQQKFSVTSSAGNPQSSWEAASLSEYPERACGKTIRGFYFYNKE